MSDTCEKCGKSLLNWRVQRAGGRNFRHGRRTIAWTCRNCGATWTEELPVDGRSDAGPSPHSSDSSESQ